MCKQILGVLIILSCAFIWAQDIDGQYIDVKREGANDEDQSNLLGTIQIEEITPSDGSRSVPYKVHFQGYLTDNAGNPVNGSVSMEFRIYTAASGGTQVWTSGTQTVNVEDGLFHKTLYISYSAFEPNESRWMEVKVSNQTLTPRIEIASSPWAYTATKADTGKYAYNSDKLDGYHYNNLPYAPTSHTHTLTLGGDLSGSGTITGTVNATVTGLRNRSVSSNAPTTGQVLKWNGSQWSPGTDNTGGGVTSISQGTGIICSPNPITSTGTISFNTNYTVPNADKLDGYHAGNSSGQIPVNNGTHCSNLNADMLDGRHASYNGAENQVVALNGSVLYLSYADNRISVNAAETGITAGYFKSNGGCGVGGYNETSAYSAIWGRNLNSSGTGVVGLGGGASSWFTLGGGTGVFGYAKYGVFGETTTSGGYGVWGYSNGGSYGVYYTGGIGGSGENVILVRTTRGPTELYTQTSCDNWVEDFGSGQLTNGRAHINLDPLFLETISIDDAYQMKVFIQLTGTEECYGVRVVKGKRTFDVVELNNGNSNATFDYRIVAKRKGFENDRMQINSAGYNDPLLYPERAREIMIESGTNPQSGSIDID